MERVDTFIIFNNEDKMTDKKEFNNYELEFVDAQLDWLFGDRVQKSKKAEITRKALKEVFAEFERVNKLLRKYQKQLKKPIDLKL